MWVARRCAGAVYVDGQIVRCVDAWSYLVNNFDHLVNLTYVYRIGTPVNQGPLTDNLEGARTYFYVKVFPLVADATDVFQWLAANGRYA